MIRRYGGWLALAAAVVLYLVLGSVDRQLKRAPHPGYLGEASWRIEAADAPRVWGRLRGLAPAQALRDECPDVLHDVALAVYRATWIRPTPARWRVWLGPQLLLGGDGEAWAGCVHPGLLIRAAHGVNRLRGGAMGNGQYRYGDLFYAWRGGFLLFSPSTNLLETALQDDAPALSTTQDAPGAGEVIVSFLLNAGQPVELRLRAAAHLPLRITLPWQGTVREGLSLADAWPDRPLFTFSASDPALPAQLTALLSMWMTPVDWPPWALELHRQAAPLIPYRDVPGQRSHLIHELSGALLALDNTEPFPVPELAVALRVAEGAGPEHPLAFMTGPAALPFFWNDTAGLVEPLLGEKWALCLASEGPLHLAASQEAVMARLMGRVRPENSLAQSLAIRIDWGRCAATAADLIREAAALELIPRMDSRDADRILIPWTRVLGRLGKLWLDGKMEAGQFIIHGELAAPLPEDRL
jgi:hypothetical protein